MLLVVSSLCLASGIGWKSRYGSLRILLCCVDLLKNFVAMNRDVAWSFDADPYGIAVDLDDLNLDFVHDHDTLGFFTRYEQHPVEPAAESEPGMTTRSG